MTRHVTIAEYFWLAERMTGIDSGTLTRASRSDVADSALHAPQRAPTPSSLDNVRSHLADDGDAAQTDSARLGM